MTVMLSTSGCVFQSTRPLRGATPTAGAQRQGTGISIHAPLAGRDPSLCWFTTSSANFNPRAPCGARRYVQRVRVKLGLISIHAPLAGRDVRGGCSLNWEFISIHAPLAGRDKERFITAGPPEFQSTRPLRGATGQDRTGVGGGLYFNPRAPCGARPLSLRFALLHPEFQSTRPLRGATPAYTKRELAELFQSTRPLRGATVASIIFLTPLSISIHAPLAGRDGRPGRPRVRARISIHAPLAGRDSIDCSVSP